MFVALAQARRVKDRQDRSWGRAPERRVPNASIHPQRPDDLTRRAARDRATFPRSPISSAPERNPGRSVFAPSSFELTGVSTMAATTRYTAMALTLILIST